MSPPLLFIHGAWHGAWCWKNFRPFFEQHGYATHALDLRGHGHNPARRSLRMTSIRDYVDDVAEAASRLPSTPILIAHSMGGFAVHHYLQSHSAVGVVFVAPVPPRGAWRATWHVIRRHPLVFAQMNAIMRLYPLVASVDLAHEMLFSPSTPRELVAEYHPLLQDESYRAYVDMLFMLPRRKAMNACPTLVLGASDDALFYEDDVRSTAEFYGTTSVMISDIGHEMMLDTRWREVAETILRWLPN